MKKIMKEAHRMTKELVEKYGVDYQTQLGLCLAYLLSNKESEIEMKKIVIADWWLEKNPAQDCILSDYSKLEITKETEKAALLNNKVWVPKSVVSYVDVELEKKVSNGKNINDMLVLLAKKNNITVEMVKKHRTLKEDYPAMYTDEPTANEMRDTAIEIDKYLSPNYNMDVLQNLKRKARKENNLRFSELNEHSKTEKFSKMYFEIMIKELEKHIK